MTPELEALIEKARNNPMTWQERLQQSRSFAFGNMPSSYGKSREEWEAEVREHSPHYFADEMDAELNRLRKARDKENEEICQTLGKALGYPWYKDDQKNFPGATEENGVCVGEHVAVSIVEEAARRIKELEAFVRSVAETDLEEETEEFVWILFERWPHEPAARARYVWRENELESLVLTARSIMGDIDD